MHKATSLLVLVDMASPSTKPDLEDLWEMAVPDLREGHPEA
jgi:hypothetical protein